MDALVSSCLVIGVGNPDRGDDAAGRAVARRLRGTLAPSVEIIEADGKAAGLIEQFERTATAFVIDACVSGASPGTVRRFDVHNSPLPPNASRLSSHGLGLAEAIELARALGCLPACCIVYAIEGASFEMGASLSPTVAEAVLSVAERLRAEVNAMRSLRWSRHA